MCVATKASPGQRDFGWSEETGQSPRCNGRQATVKAGSLSYCLTAALEKGGVKRDCCLDQEQEEEENITRGQGRRGPALQLIKATGKNVLRGVSRCYLFYAPLLCPQTSESCYTPKPCSSNTLGGKARKELSQVPEVAKAAETGASVGRRRQEQRSKLCLL